MKILIDTTKSIQDNATRYYDKSKKAKRKIEGLKKAIEVTKKKISKLGRLLAVEKKVYEKPLESKWYSKFRWFKSSDGFLCIGGRDATTNEIVMKKYADKGDLVCHAENPGSPFFVIRSEGKEIPESTILEAVQATASFSRAWREGVTTAEVYVVEPEQVKKDLGLPKGSFMINGKRKYYTAKIKLYVKMNELKELECGPIESEFGLIQGGKKTDCAKIIQNKIMVKYNVKFDLDAVIRVLPGECSLE
jgi:predicted ribosome quality control (RQC) complex YloA/Tae2 family protein